MKSKEEIYLNRILYKHLEETKQLKRDPIQPKKKRIKRSRTRSVNNCQVSANLPTPDNKSFRVSIGFISIGLADICGPLPIKKRFFAFL